MIFSKMFKRDKPLEPLKTSPGKLKTYTQCPQKYRFLYIENKKGVQGSMVHLHFDGMLNRAVESFQKMIFQGQTDIPRDALAREIDRFFNLDLFPDAQEAQEFYQAALTAGENMLRWFQTEAGTVIPWRNGPAVGAFASWFPYPITVNTRLDRIEKSRAGHLRVIDFKSGARQMVRAEMIADLGVRLQASAAREQFGSDLKTFAQVYLRTGDTVEADLDELDLDTVEEDIRELAREMQSGGYPPNCGPLCSVCEFLEMCPGWKKLPWEIAGETRETYTNRLRLSYSKMSLFERCPRAYSKLYNERVQPNPQPFFSFGSCIHGVMEDYYDFENSEKRTEEFMLTLLEKRWREYRIGYRTPEEEADYRDRAESMLLAYYNRFVKDKTFKPAASIEDYFEIPVGNDSIMTGFIDRIDELSTGGYTVLDYKTEPTDRSQESVDNDLQLTLYYWAARESLKMDIRELGLFMMSHDKIITTRRTPEDIPVVLNRIIDITRTIREETEFAPRINKYCQSCDHLAGCPLETEIRENTDLRTMEFTEDDN